MVLTRRADASVGFTDIGYCNTLTLSRPFLIDS